jgi:hypothetical protein
MKTTIEISDTLLRRAKAAAAVQGKSLKEFFTEAVQQRLANGGSRSAGKPWERAFGGLRDLHRENQRIAKLVETEFETIDEEPCH